MHDLADDNSERHRLQADVTARREDGLLSLLVTEFRIVILVGMAVAVIGSLFAEIPASVSIIVGALMGAVVALVVRVTHLI